MSYEIKLRALEERMGYQFKNKELLIEALTHSSYGDGRRKYKDNERLEFLGDRVLGLMTADMLFKASNENEGDLARRLNALVRKEACAQVARNLDMSAVLRLSKSAEKQDGRNRTSILGDVCEAVMAAVYLDGGLEAARKFYELHWKAQIETVMQQSAKDAKTELQEAAARAKASPPEYELVGRTGPDHRPEFVVKVSVVPVGEAEAAGKTKKDAERAAAEALLKDWKKQ